VATFAILTSRLPFRDLERYRGTRFMPADLEGLDSEGGAELLRRLGVHDDDNVLAQYVADLMGHPLGLLVFANSVRRVPSGIGSAAALVARDAGLAAPGTLEDKLHRVLDYYKKGLLDYETALVTAVTVFPDGASVDWVSRTMSVQAASSAQRGGGLAGVRRTLEHLAQGGILQIVPGRIQTEYTAHPIIRACFRANAGSLSDIAARLHIADRPATFIPHTLEQARAHLRAIEIYAENDDFVSASRMFEENLNLGDRLTSLGGWREEFDCLWQFLQPDRRATCDGSGCLDSFRGGIS